MTVDAEVPPVEEEPLLFSETFSRIKDTGSSLTIRRGRIFIWRDGLAYYRCSLTDWSSGLTYLGGSLINSEWILESFLIEQLASLVGEEASLIGE